MSYSSNETTDYSVAEDSVKIVRGKRGKYNWEIKISLPWNIATGNLALRDRIISERNGKLRASVQALFGGEGRSSVEILKNYPDIPKDIEFGTSKNVFDSLKVEAGDSSGVGWTIRVSLPWVIFFNDMDLRDAILLKRLVRMDSDQRKMYNVT